MAIKRRKVIDGNVSYKILLKLLKKDTFHGIINIDFKSKACDGLDDIFVDYQGYQLNELIINGKTVNSSDLWDKYFVRIPKTSLVAG